MAERFSLPPVITGSTWENVWSYFWLLPARGFADDSDGVRSPVWTNREAAAIVASLREVAARVGGFPLWYQFAAAAFGWDPDTDKLDRSKAQGDRWYPQDAATQLAAEIKRIAGRMSDDRQQPRAEARLTLDDAMFDDAGFAAEVASSLSQDGAKAEFKIPLPACKDPKTGKPRFPAPDKDGKWKCDPVIVDDPITAVGKDLLPVALVLFAIWAYGQTRGKRR